MDELQSTRKRIGLVAHDNKKPDLLAWARFNQRQLAAHELIATGTTGTLLEDELGVVSREVGHTIRRRASR